MTSKKFIMVRDWDGYYDYDTLEEAKQHVVEALTEGFEDDPYNAAENVENYLNDVFVYKVQSISAKELKSLRGLVESKAKEIQKNVELADIQDNPTAFIINKAESLDHKSALRIAQVIRKELGSE